MVDAFTLVRSLSHHFTFGTTFDFKMIDERDEIDVFDYTPRLTHERGGEREQKIRRKKMCDGPTDPLVGMRVRIL